VAWIQRATAVTVSVGLESTVFVATSEQQQQQQQQHHGGQRNETARYD